MSDVTRILAQIESGDPSAAEKLLPLVYDELRKLATAQMAREHPAQTLQATALVHEAWLRLVSGDAGASFTNRRHFYGAAAEAMRRILIESARRRAALKRGGDIQRAALPDLPAPEPDERLLAMDTALDRLQSVDPQAARLVKLRYFARCSLAEAAKLLEISPRTADRLWQFAKAWLFREISDEILA